MNFEWEWKLDEVFWRAASPHIFQTPLPRRRETARQWRWATDNSLPAFWENWGRATIGAKSSGGLPEFLLSSRRLDWDCRAHDAIDLLCWCPRSPWCDGRQMRDNCTLSNGCTVGQSESRTSRLRWKRFVPAFLQRWHTIWHRGRLLAAPSEGWTIAEEERLEPLQGLNLKKILFTVFRSYIDARTKTSFWCVGEYV